MKHCCEKFAEEAGRVQAMAGGGFMYPPGMHPNAQFEPDDDGETWNINGCCGGGCFVVTEMRFCPFCGAKLGHPAQGANVKVTRLAEGQSGVAQRSESSPEG